MTDRPIIRVSPAEWVAGFEMMLPIQRFSLSSLDEPNYITPRAIVCLDSPEDAAAVAAALRKKK